MSREINKEEQLDIREGEQFEIRKEELEQLESREGEQLAITERYGIGKEEQLELFFVYLKLLSFFSVSKMHNNTRRFLRDHIAGACVI